MMLRFMIHWFINLLIITTCLAWYCPNDKDLNPCKCFGDDHWTSIRCITDKHLNLTSIFSRVSQDARAVAETYSGIIIENNKLEEIAENALGKINVKRIEILGGSSSLKKIDSNAFAHQFNSTNRLFIEAENVDSGDSPYSIYELVNSFQNLQNFQYASRIKILEEKLNGNLTNLLSFNTRVDEVLGSPFSKMNKIGEIVLSGGNLNHIPNGAFKIGSSRDKLHSNLYINLSFNKLNGSSFEHGVFTDSSLGNQELILDLSGNQIGFLEEASFSRYLSGDKNYIRSLAGNPLDCNDCRSAWICKSLTSVKVRQSIKLAKCVDGRDLTDCENNFHKCI